MIAVNPAAIEESKEEGPAGITMKEMEGRVIPALAMLQMSGPAVIMTRVLDSPESSM